MHTKPFPALRRAIALEIHNLLAIRRSLARFRREIREGKSPNERVPTARGHVPRGMLLAYAETAFKHGVRNVCFARRALFRAELEGRVAESTERALK
jgi:hypothetical protein